MEIIEKGDPCFLLQRWWNFLFILVWMFRFNFPLLNLSVSLYQLYKFYQQFVNTAFHFIEFPQTYQIMKDTICSPSPEYWFRHKLFHWHIPPKLMLNLKTCMLNSTHIRGYFCRTKTYKKKYRVTCRTFGRNITHSSKNIVWTYLTVDLPNVYR